MTLCVPLGMPFFPVGPVNIINHLISCASYSVTSKAMLEWSLKTLKGELLSPFTAQCWAPLCTWSAEIKMTCLFLYKNAYSTFGYTIQTTTFENPPNNTMWISKQLPLDLQGMACNLSICQDRLRRECCSQGESSWRDRKSPGQWKIRSSLDLRPISQKLVVKAELDKSRCSAHVNDKATGNKLYHITEPGHTRY